MASEHERTIIIVGGGVIGCCTAYYLASHPSYNPSKHSITLIEASRIANGASGKSGGCLAPWAQPSCLSAPSFALHEQLARDHGGKAHWGFRKCPSADCGTVGKHLQREDEQGTDDDLAKNVPDWVDAAKFKWYKPLGETAQCHPYLFTQTLARLAIENGVRFIEGASVASVNFSSDRRRVEGVMVTALGTDSASQDQQEISATDVILAAGPWTGRIFPDAPVVGQKSHSVVVQPKPEIPPGILFFDQGHIHTENNDDDKGNALEIYPRPDGTVYMCGRTRYGLELPATTDDVRADPDQCKEILETVKGVAPDLGHSKVLKEQACFRPMVDVEGRDPASWPLLGETGINGLLLAAGHNEWGIQNAPITGKVLSELIFQGRAVSADIRDLDPRYYLRRGSTV